MKTILLFLLFSIAWQFSFCQEQKLWHNKERTVHYIPQGTDFVCVNPTMRFNRALYGTNTAFRVEAGDLPEFAMYMPGMGGNLQFALQKGNTHKWLIKADTIKAIYRPGSMLYEIKDAMLGNGKLLITVLALSNAEGMVIQVKSENISGEVQLVWIYGGASGKKFSRDGDIGADPESSFYLKPENCTDNVYQLSKGKFILSYGTGKVLTEEERYEIQTKPESELKGELPKNAKQITGYFPSSSTIQLFGAEEINNLFLENAVSKKNNCISGKLFLKRGTEYFLLHNSATAVKKTAEKEFADAESARLAVANRIKISTPDNYINTLGPALSIAADAVWEAPSYMHGAVAWRMRLPGWRGAYVADVLGWHNRARTHFNAYAKSQLTIPATTGVVMDTALNLARHQEKVGTQLFSDGYITRNPNGYVGAHHYDMNLVFIDQLLNHFNWTGDTAYVKQMWPLLVRHLAWEKKNFDADDDGLYDSYAAIWASDALQYSGGAVTHSSAYNYRSNKMAAQLAKMIGEDGTVYEKEAAKILNAINQQLWMRNKGWYAEYKDLLGNQLLHESAALWTIYHALDEGIADPFQAYQSLQYVRYSIPHIPILAKGLKDSSLYTLSTSNWQPYTWSLNNVALSELLHTSLAYWQGGQKEEAFRLWKSSLMESMYLGASPGNIQQLSYYDAIRGELYRDFADPIAMAGRTLVEGLFGVMPDALNNRLLIKPGLPKQWNHASLSTPDIQFAFKRNGLTDEYNIQPKFTKQLNLELILPAYREFVESVKVNGKNVNWKNVDSIIGVPSLQVKVAAAKSYSILIKWKGSAFEMPDYRKVNNSKEIVQIKLKRASVANVYQPVEVLRNLTFSDETVSGNLNKAGLNQLYLNLRQGDFSWYEPLDFILIENEEIGFEPQITADTKFERVDLSQYFNEAVTSIFKHKYLSPRPVSPSLQLPVTGIGNWAYHSLNVNISDSGIRSVAGINNEVTFNKVPFATPSTSQKNIVFTSLWDNFPDSVLIELQGATSSHAYLLMAGSTNPMQSRLVNGVIRVNYTDGTFDELELKNPENWWPIEQDYFVDGFAFTTDAPKPIRVSLKTGEEIPANFKYTGIKGFSNFAIDGGAATVLDMRLNKHKQLKNLVLKTVANDVVIGLMSVTLTR
ncbi:MAG TPA: DUF4450 domain-containing protein [Chitinophagaceae bacterium]|nr:DUF4450 domain-containing protein [Chitinophagaceae bacterium]